jgi:single-strand DNA-binding protein
MSINKVILVGNVGKDPEIRTTQDGREIASFPIATSEKWKTKNGETRERTEWHRVVVLSDGLVGITKNYLKKGNRVYIEGMLQTRKWTDKNNIEKYSTEIILQGFNNKMEILENKILDNKKDDKETGGLEHRNGDEEAYFDGEHFE